MKNSDNIRSLKDEGGSEKKKEKTDKPATRQVDRESENTPPENEIYVDLEPEELHLADDETENAQEKKKK